MFCEQNFSVTKGTRFAARVRVQRVNKEHRSTVILAAKNSPSLSLYLYASQASPSRSPADDPPAVRVGAARVTLVRARAGAAALAAREAARLAVAAEGAGHLRGAGAALHAVVTGVAEAAALGVLQARDAAEGPRGAVLLDAAHAVGARLAALLRPPRRVVRAAHLGRQIDHMVDIFEEMC